MPLTSLHPKPRLLYLITQPEWGGAQRYVFDLATSLKDNYEITVATGRIEKSRELLDRLEKAGIKTHVFQNLVREIRPLTDFQGFLEITLYLKTNKFDIVHLNSTKAGVIGSFSANLHSVPKIIYTVHGWVFNEPLPLWKKKVYKSAERLSAKSTTSIITLSQLDTEIGILEKIAKPEKFKQIYHGIRLSEIFDKNEAREKINEKYNLYLSPEEPVVGCVANFYKTKGLEYLISAEKKINQNIPEAKLIIFGDGALRPKFEKIINKHNLENKIFLPGPLTEAEKYLKAFDIFALPSVKEGLPYVILEAMHAQVPIVATRVGGIPEMIEDNFSGCLVTPANPEELADAIIDILENSQKAAQLSAKARQTVNEKFNFQKMIVKTRELYRQ